jgi:hypothetical protein
LSDKILTTYVATKREFLTHITESLVCEIIVEKKLSCHVLTIFAPCTLQVTRHATYEKYDETDKTHRPAGLILLSFDTKAITEGQNALSSK